MKAAAEAIIVLARDPRWVGGTVGVLAVLHTWTQRLVFHPHVHCLVTGGGLSDDGATWHPAGKTFLFPKSALAALARARFRNAFATVYQDVEADIAVGEVNEPRSSMSTSLLRGLGSRRPARVVQPRGRVEVAAR